MANSKYKIKTVVLRPILDLSEAEQIVENGKTSLFRSMLQKPKKTEVHAHSIKLSYEAFLILSGKYNADFYRKVIHTISVDPTVKEIVVGDDTFPVKRGKGIIGKLGTKIKSSTRKKNQIEIGEKIISQSIIGSTFETFIESESQEFSKLMIRPNIKGSAFITGEQILYKDDQDPFPQGYRLNDTWPDNVKF